MNLLSIWNGNIIPCSERKVCVFWWFCVNFLCKRVYRFCYFAVSSAPKAKKMAARFFLQGDHLVKVVLLETPFLRPMQYERMFLDSVQYGNLLHVFTYANSGGWFPGYIIICEYHIQCYREMRFSCRLNINFDKVNGAWNEDQVHRVMVHAWRVYQGQLLCKVSYSYHCCSEMHFSSRFDLNFHKISGVWNVGIGSESWCGLKSIRRTITMQGFILTAINQRTNGPVNAHLISRPCISIKHTKPG